VSIDRSFDVVVVGAGPAGLAAAIGAARRGRRVALLEKAARPGVKILMSGGNRCNLTHDCDAAGIAKAFGRRGARFLGAALRTLGPRELRAWIESLGVPTKVEPGGKVFPVSDRAVDVRDALEREMERAGVSFLGKHALAKVETRAGEGFVVRTESASFGAPKLVLATGGRSYPKSGTTGDGLRIARTLGHAPTGTGPALVPIVIEEPWVRGLSGLTLEDVELTLGVVELDVRSDERRFVALEKRRGGFLFTHFGISGPAPMNLGGKVEELGRIDTRLLLVDYLPARRRHQVEGELRQAIASHPSRSLRAWLSDLVPRRLAEALLAEHGVPPDARLGTISKEERTDVLTALFATRLFPAGTRGFDFAEVTRGGVPLSEVDPETMQSRIVPGLFLCGELLDLDGPIGGYNFTAAFATGALAGRFA
jgi:predicted Rossmann fold flavoprotein